MQVSLVWVYADGTEARDPESVEANSLGFTLEARDDDPLLMETNGRRWAISDVRPVGDEQREVVLREQP